MNFNEFVESRSMSKVENLETNLAMSLSNLMIEMHWTEEQLKSTSIPTVVQLLGAYKERSDNMEAEMRKSRKGGRHGK